ncbi:MAG: hypothetical protein HUK22_00200 [Thermoguttaceae bacterium]|nr:hypothetical protein [Thermoguttaceae bacterium]
MFEVLADSLDKYADAGLKIVDTFELVPRVDPNAKAAAEKAAATKKSEPAGIDAAVEE